MSFTRLEIERREAVATVWLSRPERRNALDTAALEEIAEAFTAFRTDFDVRAVVLAGRGPDFCAGADRRSPPGRDRLAARPDMSERERHWLGDLGRRAVRAIETCDVPTVACVHGHAIGGGFLLALACDLRVAARSARFSVPEVPLGLPLTWGGLPRLLLEVGAARAREIVLLGERFDAARAAEWGVVHRVVDDADASGAARRLAERLAALPEAAVHRTRSQLRAYAERARLGDFTEADAELLAGALRSAAARRSFALGGTDGTTSPDREPER